MIFKLWTSQISEFHHFDKKHCYSTCFWEMFEVKYLRGTYNKLSAVPLCLPLFFVFSSEVLKKLFLRSYLSRSSYNVISLCCIFDSSGISLCIIAVKFVKRSWEARNFFRRFFKIFFRLRKFILKYKTFFKFGARKFHCLTYKSFFQNVFFYFSSSESCLLKYKKNMRLESSIFQNIKFFSILDLDSFISRNIRDLLMLELEISISQR